MTRDVLTRQDAGAVAILCLNDPASLNSLSEAMLAALDAQDADYQGAVLSRDLLLRLSEDQVGFYFDRVKQFGERKAGEWLLQQSR